MRKHSERVAAIRRHEPEALEAVVRQCLPSLLRTARAAGLTRERAEDAVQESLMVFVKRAAEFDGRAKASTWIHGILMRKIWEARRGQQMDSGHEDIEAAMNRRFDERGRWAQPPHGPVEALARGELHGHLNACLEALPDRQRIAFSLREVEGFDTAEICNILAVTANNLGVLLYRARNGLRECLESKGYEGSSDVAV
jgi:RNA polymerase sigma-70 factor, ECF subfamily